MLMSKKPDRAKQKDGAEPYSSAEEHRLMLADKVRNKAYQRAIESSVSRSDVVVDLGCGVGILSLFAARAGARKVFAVEKTEIIDTARQVAVCNGLAGQIEFVHQDIRKFRPKQLADVLLHEQIGVFIWEEGLIEKIAYAREKILKPNGKILPYKIDLFLVPTSYKSKLESSIEFWQTRKYGFDFRSLAKKQFEEGLWKASQPLIIELGDTKSFLTRPKKVHSVDLRTANEVPGEISAVFRLAKGDSFSGVCGFFRVQLTKSHSFSTKPRRTNTHWGQMFFPSIEQKKIKKDSVLEFKLHANRRYSDWRFSFKLT
jgi:SAM-dependent methyltransferase